MTIGGGTTEGDETVRCAACGRGYPAERFSGGASLHCACGSRVGTRLRTGVGAASGPPRFLADVMLQRLARWLRTLGYDAAWEDGIADAELVRRGVGQRRWILTRDRGLADAWWVDNLILLTSDRPLDQLRELARTVPLSLDRLLTRCTACNVPLHPADAAAHGDTIPPGVRERRVELSGCAGCGRVYWEGTHAARMRRTLRGALGE